MIVLKIDIISDLECIIYLYNLTSDIEFSDEFSIEKFLRTLFIKLKEYYNIKCEGYYDINVYIDDVYGVVLCLKKEEFEYYDYFSNQVEMRIIINRCKFLFLVDNFDYNRDNFDTYLYDGKIYLLRKKKIGNRDLYILIEHATLIYNSGDIICNGKKIIF